MQIFDFQIFTQGQKDLIEEFLDVDDSFSEKAKILGLNPSTDFMYSDLRGADFTGSNLSGYNFTHADLRDTCGINVRGISSADFKNARLDRSIFAFPVERMHLLEDSHFDSEYHNLMKMDWSSKTNFLLSGLVDAQDRDLAKLLVHDDHGALTQNTTLFAITDIVKSDQETLEYVKSLLNIRGQNASYVTLLIQLIRRKLWSIKSMREIVIPMMIDPRPEVAVAAISAFSKSNNAIQSEINNIVRGDKWIAHRHFFTQENGIEAVPARLLNVRKYHDSMVFSFAKTFLDPKIRYTGEMLQGIVIVPKRDQREITENHFNVKLDASFYRDRISLKKDVIIDGQQRLIERTNDYRNQISSKSAIKDYLADVYQKSGVVFDVPRSYQRDKFTKDETRFITGELSRKFNLRDMKTSKTGASVRNVKVPEFVCFFD